MSSTDIEAEATPGAERRFFYPHVQAELSRPWTMEPKALHALRETAAYVLARRGAGQPLSEEEIQERIGAGPAQRQPQQQGGIAVLPVYGVLMPRASLMQAMSGGTSLQGLQNQLAAAVNDQSVSAIVLDINSPGGSVALTPETAAAVRAADAKKPVVAVCNTLCCSGAYWLASQAREIVASPSALVGSIGVYQEHFDISKLLESAGINPTLVSAGKFKVEGNEYEPLGEEALAAMQDMVDEFYGMFTGDVAKGRRVAVGDVRNGFGEGRVLTARQATTAGMVDRVDTLQATLTKIAKGQTPGTGARSELEQTVLVALTPTHFTTAATNSTNPVVTTTHADMNAAAIKPHSTEVVEEPWDGPAQEAKMPNPCGETRGRAMYAWVDSDGDPATKAAYKFPHHMVDGDGMPGAANVNGVRNAMSRLPQADIPEGDRAGVKAHLQRHLDDFNKAKAAASPNDLVAQGGEEEAIAVDPSFARYL